VVVDSAAVAVAAAEIVVAVAAEIVAAETVAEIAVAAGTKSFSISRKATRETGSPFLCPDQPRALRRAGFAAKAAPARGAERARAA